MATAEERISQIMIGHAGLLEPVFLSGPARPGSKAARPARDLKACIGLRKPWSG